MTKIYKDIYIVTLIGSFYLGLNEVNCQVSDSYNVDLDLVAFPFCLQFLGFYF